MKKIVLFSILAILLVSAGSLFAQDNSQVKRPTTAVAESKDIALSPETFQEFAVNNVGKEVEIKGMVIHVCKHGGKKMFIIGEDPEKRVKITASDKVTEFKPELEGTTVAVKGIIEPIEEEVVPEEEKQAEDADHKNYYHTPQYAISCLEFNPLD